MTTLFKLAAIASLTCLPVLAEAQGNGNGNGRGNNPLNCPPGLAKKDPACVPPGLARQGVTTQQYLDLSDDEWADIVAENPDLGDDDDTVVVTDDLFTGPLTDEEIAELFGLNLPDDGLTYGVVDGQVVRLNDEDALIFDQVKLLSRTVDTGNDLAVVPDVGLTERQLIAIYDLPPAPTGTSYSVIDGQIYAVPDETFGLLQVIRLAVGL